MAGLSRLISRTAKIKSSSGVVSELRLHFPVIHSNQAVPLECRLDRLGVIFQPNLICICNQLKHNLLSIIVRDFLG